MGRGFQEEPEYKEQSTQRPGGGISSEASSDLEIDTSSAFLMQLWGPWAASPPNAGVYSCIKYSKRNVQ